MRNTFLHTLAASVLLAAATPTAALAQKGKPAAKSATTASATTSKPLAALFAAYWDEQARLFPLDATSQDDNRYNDQLPNDQTRAFRQQQQQFYQQYLTQVLKEERSKLSDED